MLNCDFNKMNKRGTYWPKKTREYLVDFRGRTCMVDAVDGWRAMVNVKFDGSEEKYLIPLDEIYFPDHPIGYTQFI